ncbi:MAG: DUF4058 family protein [Planctomycetes bacterium]|nr:DUF4058 family protein [Planctomycetota bacterium]
MPSPFPGMDPFLEGYLWPDVHHRLASEISRQLAPRIRPRYVARITVSVVEDENPESEIGILYPDVEVLRRRVAGRTERRRGPAGTRAESAAATVTIPVDDPIEVRLPAVEVRDVQGNQLVTAIEILSPVNKREPGLSRFRRKRHGLYQAGVHWLEIDLLRRGRRGHPGYPDSPYLAALTRAGAGSIQVWPIGLRDTLPGLPVPLLAPDPDARIDLGAALAAIYDEAAYELTIDYSEAPPPPDLAPRDSAWMRKLHKRGARRKGR